MSDDCYKITKPKYDHTTLMRKRGVMLSVISRIQLAMGEEGWAAIQSERL